MTITRRIVLIVAAAVAAACSGPAAGDRVCFSGTCFRVELAVTQPERSQGLMHRESLPADAGMLFIFGAERPYSFWMKNTLIPLDIIWLDYSRRVIHIEPDVPPCKADPCPSYGPEANALYVLELNAGKAREAGIKPGDTAEFRLKSLKAP